MFGSTRFFSHESKQEGHPEVATMGHVVAFGLALPFVLGIVGGLNGGVTTALIGFALGLAACAAMVLVATLLTSR